VALLPIVFVFDKEIVPDGEAVPHVDAVLLPEYEWGSWDLVEARTVV